MEDIRGIHTVMLKDLDPAQMGEDECQRLPQRKSEDALKHLLVNLWKRSKWMRLVQLLLLISLPLGAEIVQIGNGSLTNQSLPIESARNYSYSQQIYLASQISTQGYITSIAFQYSVSGNLFYQNNSVWKVWLGHTDREHLETWIPLDSMALAYDGTLALADFSNGLPGQGWMTITLLEPFFFDAAHNLLIAVDENTPGSSSTSDEFLCSAAPQVRGIVFSDMNINPDPAAPPTTGFWSRQVYANIRLELTVFSLVPYLPVPPDQATGVALDTNLQWQSNASSFDLYIGTSPQAMQHLGQGLTQTQWNLPEPLQMLRTYYWQVIGHHQSQDYPGQIWCFTTIGEGIGAPQNLTAYYNGDEVQLHWDAPQNGSPILYRVYRNGLFLAISSAEAYLDAEVSAGQVHYYYVRAENALGEVSQQSNTATVHIPDVIPNLIFQQGFEACTPFTQEISGWTNLDLDGFPTWNWTAVDFPSEGNALGWLSFFPALTVPPIYSFPAHSGAATLVSISSMTPPNNDWLISPRLNLGTQPSLTFWARSHTGDYGLERLRVLISTTDSAPSSFTTLNSGNWISVPAQWTEFTYALSAWQNQSVYLAWNCVTWDAFALYLDDIVLTGAGGYVALDDALAPALDFQVCPNPSSGYFSLSNPAKTPFDLTIYDLRGRQIWKAASLTNFNSAEHSLNLSSGIYLLKVKSTGKEHLQRLAIIK